MKEIIYTKYKLSFNNSVITAKVSPEKITIRPGCGHGDKFQFKLSDRETARRISKLIAEACEL